MGDSSSPLARLVAAARFGVQAGAELRAAARAGFCVNCRKVRTTPPAKLCDECGEELAEAGVHVLGAAVNEGGAAASDIARNALRDFFTGRGPRRP